MFCPPDSLSLHALHSEGADDAMHGMTPLRDSVAVFTEMVLLGMVAHACSVGNTAEAEVDWSLSDDSLVRVY